MVSYKVSDANSYIVVTGAGIDDVRIVKKSFVWPFQKANVISISPFDFEITLQAMTIEKLNFSLPAVFTIGPDNNPESLRKYAMLLTGNSDGSGKKTPTQTGRSHVQTIVKGIIEGETRVIVSGMTMEEIFKERQVFKQAIIENVQSELQQFGLKIYNANVKELQDTAGSEYFKVLSRKAHESAANTAKVDVATARMLGEIGEAEKRGKTRQEISKIDAQTAVLETQRKSEQATADAELATTQTRLNMNISIAQIQATRQSEARDAELQKDVESKRAEMELERRRAKDVVNAKIEREAAQQRADAKYYTDTKSADGDGYKARQAAEAAYFRAQKEADAHFYAQKQEAAGIAAMANAYAAMADTLGGPAGLLQYLMLQSGTYEKLATANAKAINGLAPKISVWNTGSDSDSGAPAGKAIADLYKALPPLLSTVQEQTGIMPPSWLAGMPMGAGDAYGPMSQGQGQEVVKGKGKATNGTNGNY